MTHAERLAEIEKDLSFVLGINTENRSIVDCYDTFHNEQCVGHIKYLLTRVKVLTEALEDSKALYGFVRHNYDISKGGFRLYFNPTVDSMLINGLNSAESSCRKALGEE